jgi:hypothetical protein
MSNTDSSATRTRGSRYARASGRQHGLVRYADSRPSLRSGIGQINEQPPDQQAATRRQPAPSWVHPSNRLVPCRTVTRPAAHAGRPSGGREAAAAMRRPRSRSSRPSRPPDNPPNARRHNLVRVTVFSTAQDWITGLGRDASPGGIPSSVLSPALGKRVTPDTTGLRKNGLSRVPDPALGSSPTVVALGAASS